MTGMWKEQPGDSVETSKQGDEVKEVIAGPGYIESYRADLAFRVSDRKPLDAIDQRSATFRSQYFHKITLASMTKETQGE